MLLAQVYYLPLKRKKLPPKVLKKSENQLQNFITFVSLCAVAFERGQIDALINARSEIKIAKQVIKALHKFNFFTPRSHFCFDCYLMLITVNPR